MCKGSVGATLCVPVLKLLSAEGPLVTLINLLIRKPLLGKTNEQGRAGQDRTRQDRSQTTEVKYPAVPTERLVKVSIPLIHESTGSGRFLVSHASHI